MKDFLLNVHLNVHLAEASKVILEIIGGDFDGHDFPASHQKWFSPQ